MSAIRENDSGFDLFDDEEALAIEIAELKIEIARIEKMKDESDWEHKLREKITDTPGARQPERDPISDITNKDNWDFSSEFASVDVYDDEEVDNPHETQHISEKDRPSNIVEYERNPRINPDLEEDDEIVQLPPESEELTSAELLEEREIVQAPRQVTPPSINPLTDSEIQRKKLQPAPKKIMVRKNNDAEIIKEMGLGEGQRALREAREDKNLKTYVIQASKPDSGKIRKKLLKSLADLRYENVNIAKVEIDFQSTRPYIIIGKSLTRRQAHEVMSIMRVLRIPASVKVEKI